jgi:hypothetical protein
MVLFIYVLNSTPPRMPLFPFLCKFMLVPLLSRLIFGVADHVFFCLTPKETVGLTLPAVGGQKRAAPPFNHGKITTRIIRISIKIICFPNLFELIVTWNGTLD